MKRFLCAGVVGLALLITGAAKASDFGDYGNDFGCYKDKGCDYKFKFDPCKFDDKHFDCGCDKKKYDDFCGHKDKHDDYCDDYFCHHDHSCDPDAVPLPSSSALGGAGLVLAGIVKWLRSRRTSIA